MYYYKLSCPKCLDNFLAGLIEIFNQHSTRTNTSQVCARPNTYKDIMITVITGQHLD